MSYKYIQKCDNIIKCLGTRPGKHITTVEVVDYDPEWPIQFNAIVHPIRKELEHTGITYSVEHVGSTSVPGLAAKPVIDIDFIVQQEDVLRAIYALHRIGYMHRGELGIDGRHAFMPPNPDICDVVYMARNVYVVIIGCNALRNHLLLRNHLRDNRKHMLEYAVLKKQLAKQFPNDIDAYCEAKTNFIVSILKGKGTDDETITIIEKANRR